MPAVAALEYVRNLPLFTGLTEQEKDGLIQGGRQRQVSRAQMLFTHSDPVTHFYVLIKGTMQLFRTTPDGHEKTIAVVKAGQTMCEDEIMDACHSHRTNGLAVEDSIVLEFPVAWLKEAAKKHNNFARNLLSMISSRAHMAEVEAEHRATMTAAQLVACFIQRLCVLYNFSPKGFELPYSKTLIASRLGMELETFSRTLGKLKEHGIIVEGNHAKITDLEKIGEYVCSACSISGECATHQAMEKKIHGA